MTDGPATGVLVVNAGSSSLKLRVLGLADAVTGSADISPWDGGPDDPALEQFLAGLTGIGAAGHRVVHGGRRFTAATASYAVPGAWTRAARRGTRCRSRRPRAPAGAPSGPP